jgi:hypothetical protein
VSELRLETREFTDLTRWRWELRDAAGELLAAHDVRLDPSCWQFEAFTDLRRYAWWHAAPERRLADETRIVGDVGAWAGTEVLGLVGAALRERRPATVRVVAPEPLLSRPLELAHAGGQPLSAQELTLVFQRDRDGALPVPAKAPSPSRPRVLALFSPPGRQPLSLRRERDALASAVPGARILQYGVTRDRLRAVLAEGWDVVHVHGHGTSGGLLLQTAAGAPDPVSAADLAALLDLTRDRVKLVTLFASQPAAIAIAQQRRVLGLPAADHRAAGPGDAGHPGADSAPTGALAARVAERLGCAVLATRYPVSGEFAAALAGTLHPLLAEGRPLAEALGVTLRRLAAFTTFPALSQAAPFLVAPSYFGGAADVTLSASAAQDPGGDRPASSRMTGFGPRPPRFAGRAGVLSRASTVLAPGSGTPGVLLHGAPGTGKTTCALELAYGHEEAFDRLVCCTAGELTDFALALEDGLPGFRMAGAAVNDKRLDELLPRLTELMARRRVLLVIDDAGALLNGEGGWRDPRWGQVIGALTAHAGLGRVIITSDVLIAAAASLRAEEIGPLTEDDALLLARELPRLRVLVDGPALTDESPLSAGRVMSPRLARDVLDAARGVPLLLELADGQAASPRRLTDLVAAVCHAEGAGDLAAWTCAVTGTLSLSQRHLFWLLCCLEEPDRDHQVIDAMCARLWRLLYSSPGDTALFSDTGPVLQPMLRDHTDRAIAALAESALITVHGESYAVHPAIAAIARAQAGRAFQEAVDLEAAMFWDAEFKRAAGPRPALAAVPYLARQEQWTMAAGLLDAAVAHDPSRATAAAVLPLAGRIAAREPWAEQVLGSVLQIIDPAGAEAQLRVQLDVAVAEGNHHLAATIAEQLAGLCLDDGRPGEALGYAEDFIDHAGQAGLGDGSQLRAEVLRLAVRDAQGQHDIALAEAYRLRARIDSLRSRGNGNGNGNGPGGPADPGEPDDLAGLREAVLATGHAAAVRAGRWDEAVDLNAALVQSMRDRGAAATDIARTRFNGYRPLLRLGQTGKALDVLLTCRAIFSADGDAEGLGKTLGALASIEDATGNRESAAGLQRESLRHSYAAGDAPGIATGYYNLASYAPHRPTVTLARYLAAALIFTLAAGAGNADYLANTDEAVRRAGADRRDFGAIPPADIADLCAIIGDIPGTSPDLLIARLARDPGAAERALRELIAQVVD